MNDFDQTINTNLSGFESYREMKHSLLPDFNAVLQKRLVPTQQDLPGFDPHQLMVKKHKVETGEVAPDTTISSVQWPEKDMEVLNDFCKQHNIMGFNCGRMSPISALAFLKNKIGLSDKSLSERIPFGYEKIGAQNIYNVNYPYDRLNDKRKILNG